MCFCKEGPACILPSMQKGFRRPHGGPGRQLPRLAWEGIPQPYTHTSSLSFCP